tara:strand:- start:43 stop:1515 length:1473 start_codon:yes stop_codon:yes gene_type:complete
MAGSETAARRKKTQARAAEPAFINRLDVLSTESSDTVSLIGGTVRLQYWESILADSIRAMVTFTDAGNTLRSTKQTSRGRRPSKKKVSAVEGLPITGGEKVSLKFTDNNGNILDFNDQKNNSLYMNKLTPLPTGSETTDKSYMMDLSSLEFINNETGKTKVRKCMSGIISDHVTDIFENVMKTEKDLDIEQTTGNLDYVPNNTKPFYCLNELSTKAVKGKAGETAGYFFWETANSYHFKSIDTLMGQDHVLRVLYNESTGKPPEPYDVKALKMETNNNVNVQKKFMMGAYSNKTFLINPFSGEVTNQINAAEAFAEGNDLKLAGEALPTLNTDFSSDEPGKEYSYISFQLASTGQINYGPIEDQLSKSKELNFDAATTFNQSKMRYNQLFAAEITIVIPGDFSLHAGDSVWMDIPQTDTPQSKACGDDVSKLDGGKYLVTDLCHFITARDTYTKLVLIRDSFGRKGNPSKGSSSSNADKAMKSSFLPFFN